MGKCEVCNEREGVRVASVPGVPYSCAWCRECLASGAIPYWIAVFQQACLGEGVSEWWDETVTLTLEWTGHTREEFERDVNQTIEEMNEYFDKQEAAQAASDEEWYPDYVQYPSDLEG